MYRSRVLALSLVLTLICATLAVSGMLYLARVHAIDSEKSRLFLFAQRAITRAQLTFNDIRAALFAVDALNVEPCSPAHIAAMRRLTVSTRSIDEIGYFENGMLKCTSWGLVSQDVAQSTPDFVTDDGIKVTLRMIPIVNQGTPMMALQYRSHNVLTGPSRFADIIVDPGVRVAVATDTGYLLGDLNLPDAPLIKKIIAGPVNDLEDGNIIAVARGTNLIAVAIEPDQYLFQRLRSEDAFFLPIGILLAVIATAIIVWFTRRRLSPLGELKQALRKEELLVHYQPIIELATGFCVGAEALLRWKHPTGEILHPDDFVSLAEDNGLIQPIDDQVIQIVVRDLQSLLVSDRNLHVAINLNAEDVKTGRGLEALQAALSNTGIENRQIWLEASERSFTSEHSTCLNLSHARSLGHSVAIDDFGTGYSSLSALQKLPLDAVKIDKSFIDVIDTDSVNSSVTPHIIAMAKTLYLKIFAEGIETTGQVKYLRQQKVDYGQGWLFAMAMPVDEFISYYQKNRKPVHGDADNSPADTATSPP